LIKISVIAIFVLLLNGCAINASKKRPANPIAFHITDNITLTSTGAVNINVPFFADHVDFFPSSFRLEAKGRTIYIDPVIPADCILITHPHGDHFSITDIKKVLKKETVLVCPEKVYTAVTDKLPVYRIKKIKPGDTIQFEEIVIETIPAYNLKPGFIGLTPHPKSTMNVGYVITVDSIRIYQSGDTDYVPELNQLTDIAIALVPIDGGGLTMSNEKATELINTIKPNYAIPVHYSLGTDQIAVFRELIDVDTEIIMMDGQK